MKGAFSGDWHYGLQVEDLDRTPDVHKAVMFIVDEVIKRKLDFFSIGGDLTETNSPIPDHIALLIKVFNRLEDAEIPTFVTKGNHCSISAAGRLWGLTPLEQVGYQNVHFITAPKLIQFEKMQFVFLPHTTRAQALEAGFKSAQEFINARAVELLTEATGPVTVISHYNVSGAKAGTEALMLRQSDLQLPDICLRSSKVTKIVNSHIHTAQEMGKLIMPGSPVCTDFGDLDAPKIFLVGDYRGKEWKFERVLTPASPMQEIELNLVGATPKEIKAVVDEAKASIVPDAIVKARVIVNEENLTLIDFDKLRADISKKARFLKQFDRTISRKRQVRDAQQKSGLAPLDAVKRYLDHRQPEGKDRKLALAQRFLSGEKVTPADSGHEFLSPIAASDALTKNLKELTKETHAREEKPKPARAAPAKRAVLAPVEDDFDFDGGIPQLDL